MKSVSEKDNLEKKKERECVCLVFDSGCVVRMLVLEKEIQLIQPLIYLYLTIS